MISVLWPERTLLSRERYQHWQKWVGGFDSLLKGTWKVLEVKIRISRATSPIIDATPSLELPSSNLNVFFSNCQIPSKREKESVHSKKKKKSVGNLNHVYRSTQLIYLSNAHFNLSTTFALWCQTCFSANSGQLFPQCERQNLPFSPYSGVLSEYVACESPMPLHWYWNQRFSHTN